MAGLHHFSLAVRAAWDRFFAPVSIAHHRALYYEKLGIGVVISIVALFLIQAIPNRLRKPTIALCTFLAGLYYAAEFFIPVHKLPDGSSGNFLTPYFDFSGNFANVLFGFAIGLGVISLLGLHLRAIGRMREGWGFSVVLVVAFLAMTVFGIMNEYWPHARIAPAISGFSSATNAHDVYSFLFNGGLASLDSAMFALIGFYIISASYRAFRIRSVEASLLMLSALIVMLGQVTLGTAITNRLPITGNLANLRFENMAAYILVQINAPAIRAVTFGLAVGLLATSLRLWLSLERNAYFDQEA